MKFIDFKYIFPHCCKKFSMKIITNNCTVLTKYKTELMNSSVTKKSHLEKNYGKI